MADKRISIDQLHKDISYLETQGAGPNDIVRYAKQAGYTLKHKQQNKQSVLQSVLYPIKTMQSLPTPIKSAMATLDPTGISQTRALYKRPDILSPALGMTGSVLGSTVGMPTAGGAAGGAMGELLKQGIEVSENRPGAPQSFGEGARRVGLAAAPYLFAGGAGKLSGAVPALRGGLQQAVIQGGAAGAGTEFARQITGDEEFNLSNVANAAKTPAIIGSVLSLLSPGMFGGKRVLQPKISPRRLEPIESARRLKIPDLTIADVTGGKGASIIESTLEKSPLGAGPIEARRIAQMQRLNTISNRLQKAMGTEESSASVGARMKDIYSKELSKRSETAKSLYQFRDKLIPDNAPVETPNLTKAAEDILHRQSRLPPTERDSSLTSLASDIVNKRGKSVFDSMQLLKQSIGGKVDRTFAGTEYLKLKNAADLDINSFSRSLEGKVPALSESASRYYKTYKDFERNPLFKALRTNNPEDVIPAIFQRRNLSEIKALKTDLPVAFKMGKKIFTKDLLSKSNISGELRKIDPDTLKTLYTSRELRLIKDLANAKGILSSAERIAGNPSGTGQVVNTMAAARPMSKVLTNPIRALAETTAGFGVPYFASKAYLSSPVTSAFTRGLNVPSVGAGSGRAISESLVGALLQRKLQREQAGRQ